MGIVSVTYERHTSHSTTRIVYSDGAVQSLTYDHYFPSSPILHSPAVIYGSAYHGAGRTKVRRLSDLCRRGNNVADKVD